MLIIVFSVAITKQNIFIVLFLLIIQIFAALWYSISYIPFARQLVISVLRRSPCGPLIEAIDQVKGAAAEATSSGQKNNTSNKGGMNMKGFTLLNDDV
jgi:hypothetical protein